MQKNADRRKKTWPVIRVYPCQSAAERFLEIRRLAYAAFGEEAENQGSGDDPKYKYTGKEHDSSGLYYYGARYYDPALSRFITADTVYDVGPQGLNRYSYALNNPIIYRDPTGHFINGPVDDPNPVGRWNMTGSQADETPWLHSKSPRPRRLQPSFFGKTSDVDDLSKWNGVVDIRERFNCSPNMETCDGRAQSCTGALIDPKVVLTAAHCTSSSSFEEYDDFHYKIKSPGKDWEEIGSGKIFIQHRPSDESNGDDIAVIILDKEVSGYDIYPLDKQIPKKGEKGINFGFGSPEANVRNATLIGSQDQYLVFDVDKGRVHGGDSGGPTFIMRNGQWYITAINNVNGIYFEGKPGYPGMLPVAKYSEWIDETVVKHTGHHLGEY